MRRRRGRRLVPGRPHRARLDRVRRPVGRERAERLASHAEEAGVATRVLDFSERAAALSDVDLAISATGADNFTIEAADLPAGRELMLIDLSLPRDIDDAAAAAEGVDLVNIERLSKSLSAASTDLAAGTSPPRVMATIALNGPAAWSRQASARASRWN